MDGLPAFGQSFDLGMRQVAQRRCFRPGFRRRSIPVDHQDRHVRHAEREFPAVPFGAYHSWPRYNRTRYQSRWVTLHPLAGSSLRLDAGTFVPASGAAWPSLG